MARFMFPRFGAELLRQSLDADLHGCNDLKAYAFDAGEHTLTTADEFISDITAGGLEGTAVVMTTVAVDDDGNVSFDDFTFPGISGDTVEGVLYAITHTALGEEVLVYYDDNADFTPDGNNVDVTYSGAAFRIIPT